MRKITLLLSILLSCCYVDGQGINHEKGWQKCPGHGFQKLRSGDGFYLLLEQREVSEYSNSAHLSKHDTLGNVVWEKELEQIWFSDVSPMQLELDSNGNIYTLTNSAFSCYPISDCKWNVQHYDSDGNLIWSREWDNYNCFSNQINGLTIHQDGTVGLNIWQTNTFYSTLRLGQNGQTIDSVSYNAIYPQGNAYFSNGTFLSIESQDISLIDGQGTFLTGVNFLSPIVDAKIYNDTLYVLTNDDLQLYNNGLVLIGLDPLTGYDLMSNLKVNTEHIRLLAQNQNNTVVIRMSHNLTNMQSVAIPFLTDYTTAKDFDSEHLTIAESHYLYDRLSLRIRDFSLLSATSNTVTNRDVGISDIDFNQFEITQVGPTGNYALNIWANVEITNYGNVPVSSCRLLHSMGFDMYTCNSEFYDTVVENINLAPGASLWINLGLIHENYHYFFDDTLTYNVCMYTANPDNLVDLEVSNDHFCKELIAGYAGMVSSPLLQKVSIFPNPADDVVNISAETIIHELTLTDVSGRQVLFIQPNSKSYSLPISLLSSGSYCLKMGTAMGESMQILYVQ